MILKLILLATLLLFSGCSMSKETHTESTNLSKKIDVTDKSIKEKETSFINNKDTKKLDVYAKKEDLTKSFSNARVRLEKAKTQYNNELLPLMKKDDNDDESKALALIGSINTQLRMSNIEANTPSKRIAELKDFIANKEMYYKKAKELKKLSNNKTNTFKLLTEKATKEYPAKTEDLKKRFNGMQTIDNNISTLFKTLETEYKSESPDFSTFSKAYKEMTLKDKESYEYSITQTKKVNELFQSYSKILTDMRERYYITIGRLSWHEGEEEWPTETNYIFPKRELSSKAFEYFDSVSEEEMGSLSSSWGSGRSLNTNWNAYFISQLNLYVEENMPSGDNSADFWINSLYTENFHKYTIIKNGVKHETEWESVTPEYFESNSDNMGMEIISKPYGFYEDEKITTAGPAGMGYVGDKHYGEWKNDGHGGSFWTYYGMYSFLNNMTMGSGYSRDDYNSYQNNRKNNQGYYGKKEQYGTYGSSTYKNSKYSKSEYARNHKGEINAARHKTSNGALRNAGHNARGRGPGGGGK